MTVTDPRGECRPTRRQELLLKACLWDGDRALKAWQLWDAQAGFDHLDPESHCLMPLLYANLSRLGVQHPRMPKLKGIYRWSWLQTRTLSRKLAGAVHLLEAHAVPTLLLNAAPLVALFPGDAGLRPGRALSIVIPEEQALAALELLRSNGWRPDGEHWNGENELGSQSSIPLVDSQDRRIQLHAHVLHQFWEAAVPFAFEGVPTRTLCATDHLLHACGQGPHPGWVADSARILRSARIDWNRLVALTDRLQIGVPVSAGLGYLASVLKLPVPAEVLKRLALFLPPAGPLEWIQRRHATYAQRTRGRSVSHKVRVIGSWSLLRLNGLVRSRRLLS